MGGSLAVAPDALPDPIAVAVSFTALLERLGVPYLVCGSFASSIHGEPRSTNDIDIVADVRPGHIRKLVAMLGSEYYVSAGAIRDAVRDGGAFNVIHVNGGIKIDVFVAGRDPFDLERLRTRELVRTSTAPSPTVYVDTSEYSILRKLEWFRRGGGVSERQWRDVLGILRVQGERLDLQRLREWAARLGVSDLLALALATRESEAR